VKLGKIEQVDRSVEVEISNPGEEEKRVVVPTRERIGERLKGGMLVLGSESKGEVQGKEDTLTQAILALLFTYNSITQCLVYKKVANRVRLVPGTMPTNIRIIRQFLEDPLRILLYISPHPSIFLPGVWLTHARIEKLGLLTNKFLWPEERELVAQVLWVNEQGLAWEETEKERFRDKYFSPVKIPVQEHVLWAQKTLPILPGIREKVIELIQKKIDSGVYEPSYSSYRHQWFTVAKKDGNIRIVHNLTSLNAVTICDT